MTTTVVRTGSPRRLGVRTRRAVLIVHIASAGAWLGVDVAMAVLIGTAMFAAEQATVVASLQALELVSVWPLLVCGLVCLVSGLVLGARSRWGVVRYWWVAVKLALNVVLTLLVVVALAPGVYTLAEQARQVAGGGSAAFDLWFLYFPPTVSPTLLLVAMTLSVVKPWGRIRRGAAAQG